MQFSTLLPTVRVALLRSSWRSCFMRAALFIMRVTNSSLVFTFSLHTSLFIHPHKQKYDLYAPTSNSCISTPNEKWTHVYKNLFTRNSPYYHILKYICIPPETPCIYKKKSTLYAMEQLVEPCATIQNDTGCLGIEPALWLWGRLGL